MCEQNFFFLPCWDRWRHRHVIFLWLFNTLQVEVGTHCHCCLLLFYYFYLPTYLGFPRFNLLPNQSFGIQIPNFIVCDIFLLSELCDYWDNPKVFFFSPSISGLLNRIIQFKSSFWHPKILIPFRWQQYKSLLLYLYVCFFINNYLHLIKWNMMWYINQIMKLLLNDKNKFTQNKRFIWIYKKKIFVSLEHIK
jgi:hypothetical protein